VGANDSGVSAADAASASDAAAGSTGTTDAAGTPDQCVPGTTRASLENACTTSDCVPFAGVVPTCDGGPCPLPAPAANASDAGIQDASLGTDTGADATTEIDSATNQGSSDSSTEAAVGGGDSGASNPCSALQSNPANIIFITGSTALASFIGEVSKVLATEPTSPITVVYQGSGSCIGVRAAIDAANNPLSPTNGAATYYDATGAQQTCSLDPDGGEVADIGASDVFYSTCYLGQPNTPALPTTVSENLGPVQIMNFAVPQASTQRSISLAAAYVVFGFGGQTHQVPPWTDPQQLQIRSSASGTQAMIAAAIGVPPAAWKGVSNKSSALVGSALVSAGQSGDQATIDSALGILASDYLIQNSQTLSGLAVQDFNTSCGYYPNSTATARDAANVRDGHYPLWGPSHFYARVDPVKQLPLKAGVSQFIDGLSGVTQLPGLDLVGEYAAKGLVPSCAMHAKRSSDGGDYSPFTASVTCNCYFDLIATGNTSCKPCSTSGDCPSSAPNCNKFGPAPQQGYCDL
jgi:hypothetical protein